MSKKQVSFRPNRLAGGSRPPKSSRSLLSTSSDTSIVVPARHLAVDLGSADDYERDNSPDPLSSLDYQYQPPTTISRNVRPSSPIRSRSTSSRPSLSPSKRPLDSPRFSATNSPPKSPNRSSREQSFGVRQDVDASEPIQHAKSPEQYLATSIRSTDSTKTSQSEAVARPINGLEIDELLREERFSVQHMARIRRAHVRQSRERIQSADEATRSQTYQARPPLSDYEETTKAEMDYLWQRKMDLDLETEFSGLSVTSSKPKEVESQREQPVDGPGWIRSFLSRLGLSASRPSQEQRDDITLCVPTAFKPPDPSPPSSPSVEEIGSGSEDLLDDSDESSAGEEATVDEYARPIKRNLLPHLTSEEDTEAGKTQRKPAQEKVVKGLDNDFLTGHDFNKLQPGDWLNDAIINAYIPLVAKTINESDAPPAEGDPPAVVFFNSFLCSRLETRRANDKPWREFFRGANKKKIGGASVLKTKLILIPVNEGSNHWTLLTIYPRLREIHYLNSIHKSRSKQAELVKEWLTEQLLDAKLPRADAENWKIVIEDVPQQHNGCDCGVFTLTNARLLASGFSPHSAGQRDMENMRYLITWELSKQKLKDHT